MHPTILAGWVWVVAAVGLHVLLVLWTFLSRAEEGADFQILFVPLGLSATGLLVLAMTLLGLADPAQWAWRISGTLVALLALTANVRSGLSPAGRVVALLNLGMGILVAGLGFLAGPLTVNRGTAVARGVVPASIVINGVQFWHGLALGLLALGTVVFLMLFVQMLERGISPQLESLWSGIGGGLGGWRASPSLAYLAAAAVFGSLFAVFVLRLEPRPDAQALFKVERSQTSADTLASQAGTVSGADSTASRAMETPR